jgi:hypothetical protein
LAVDDCVVKVFEVESIIAEPVGTAFEAIEGSIAADDETGVTDALDCGVVAALLVVDDFFVVVVFLVVEDFLLVEDFLVEDAGAFEKSI